MTLPNHKDLSSRIDKAALLAAPALILLTPFVSFLRYHSYDLLAAEALLCIAALAATGLAIGAVIAVRPSVLCPIVLFVMTIPWLLEPAVVAILFIFDAALVRAGVASAGSPLAARIAYGLGGLVGVFLFALFWMLRRHVGEIAAGAFGVMLIVAALASNGRGGKTVAAVSGSPPRPGLPPIVHLVLDEHIGVAGLPEDIEGAGELKGKIVAFYQRHGFRLYSHAFSHYWNTTDSLSNLLNGTAAPLLLAQVDRHNTQRLSVNRWFLTLREQGYQIEVLQTDHLDFCAGGGVDICSTYLANSIGTLRHEARVRPATAALAIMYAHLSRSRYYRITGIAYERALWAPATSFGVALPSWKWERLVVGPLLATRAVDDLADAIRRTPNGRAFFAHVMVPHNSYMFDRTCAIEGNALRWRDRGDSLRRPFAPNSAEDRAARYGRYLEQVECTYRFIDKVVQALGDTGGLDRAVVLVHGDHGSRIGIRDPLASWRGLVSQRDILDFYSTLYAIRAPSVEPGVSDDVVSIQSLFAEQMLKDRPSPRLDRVYLPPADAKPLTPLPTRSIVFDADAMRPATAEAFEPMGAVGRGR